jgi:alkanesulfonate monooxygenase SsuD/methylene tetrahydromethanopterin reductase-like flavin-dependent oxidoreductase (luciferase family)
MDISVSFEALFGLNWPRWKDFVPRFDGMGFKTIYQSDHFFFPPEPVLDSLELITSLTYLAAHTERVQFGSLVAPLSFREPVMLARQAMSLNLLSGGRMIIGLGAGWLEEEHRMFGYPLGEVRPRMDRFEEGVEVISRLIHDRQPVTYSGQHFRLEGAQLLPHSQPKILIGGNGQRRTLPLAARYADIWNCLSVPSLAFRELSEKLDQIIVQAGRQPAQVKRTFLMPLSCWETPADQERLLQHYQAAFPSFPLADFASVVELLQRFGGTSGTPADLIAIMEEYAAAGVEEFVIQWPIPNDIDSLQLIAERIVPHFAHQPVI